MYIVQIIHQSLWTRSNYLCTGKRHKILVIMFWIISPWKS